MTTRLGWVADIRYGFPFNSQRFTDDQAGGARVVRIRDLASDADPIYTDETPGFDVAVDVDDLLVGMDGDFNVARWKGSQALLNQRVARVRATAADQRFLYFAMSEPLKAINAMKFSTTVKHLSDVDLRRLPIPTLGLRSQRFVADFLDCECARIESLRSCLEALAHVAAEPALSLFSDRTRALSRVRVGYHYEVLLGKMLDAAKQADGEELPYLRNSNVSWDSFDLGDVKTMRLQPSELDRYSVRCGDLLACEGRHVGKCAIWAGQTAPMYYQKALHRIRPREDWSNRYLLWFLWLGNFRGDFYADGTGSTIPHLPAEKLRALKMPSLSLEFRDFRA